MGGAVETPFRLSTAHKGGRARVRSDVACFGGAPLLSEEHDDLSGCSDKTTSSVLPPRTKGRRTRDSVERSHYG